jgi:hypothetical protein
MKRKIRTLVLIGLALGFLGYAFFPSPWVSWSAWYALEHASKLTLYSVEPLAQQLESIERIHEYPVLGSVLISSNETRPTIAQAIRRGVANWNKQHYACFDPRHCVRAVCGPFTYDFLICYDCHRIEVYRGNVLIGVTGITDVPKTLNDILIASNVPLPIAPADLQGDAIDKEELWQWTKPQSENQKR